MCKLLQQAAFGAFFRRAAGTATALDRLPCGTDARAVTHNLEETSTAVALTIEQVRLETVTPDFIKV